MNTKYLSKTRILLLCTILFFIESIILNYAGYKLAAIMFIFIGIPFYISLKIDNKFLFILFSLPFAAVIKASENAPSFIIVLMFILMISIIKKKEFSFNYNIILGLLIIFISQISSVILFNANLIKITAFTINISFLVIVLRYFSMRKHTMLFKDIALMYSSSMLLSIILVLIFPRLPFIILFNKANLLESVNRFSGINGDPNYYSQLVLIGISLQLVSLFNAKGRYIFYHSAAVIVLIFFGLWSRSKSFVITLSVVLLYAIFLLTRRIIRNKGVTVLSIIKVFVIQMLCLITIFYFIILLVIPVINSRTDSADFSNGRTEIWLDYLYMFEKEPIIIFTGVGFGNGERYIEKYMYKISAAHNIIIELIADIGLISMAILTFILSKNIDVGSIKNDGYLVIIAIGFSSLALSISSNDAIYIVIPIIGLFENPISNISFCSQSQSDFE